MTLFAFTVITLMAAGCSAPQKPSEPTTSTVETIDSAAVKLDNAKQTIDESVEDVKQKMNDLN